MKTLLLTLFLTINCFAETKVIQVREAKNVMSDNFNLSQCILLKEMESKNADQSARYCFELKESLKHNQGKAL